MELLPHVSSQSPYLLYVAGFFGTPALYYGLNGMIRPRNALGVFQFPYPKDKAMQKLVDNLMVLYGVRDVFMALSIYTAVYFEQRVTTGLLLIFVFFVAVTDGFVNKAVIGTGEWTHWGYAPVVGAVGVILTGVLDR